jgi:hypothetical protein
LILSDKDKSISVMQRIPHTRHSERLQDQMVKKFQMKGVDESKKRTLEGMELLTKNSFFVLGIDKISALAAYMGVKISLDNFDTIDIMRDLEMARLALDKVKCVKPPNLDLEENPISEVDVNDVPLLEWLDVDSEAEQFILVQSRKTPVGKFSWSSTNQKE